MLLCSARVFFVFKTKNLCQLVFKYYASSSKVCDQVMGLLPTPSPSVVFAPRRSYIAAASLETYRVPFCLNWSRRISGSESVVTLQRNCPPIRPKRRFVFLSAEWHDKDDDNKNNNNNLL